MTLKNHLFKSKKKKGFTIIELMAVMAIILILAAAFIPKFSSYITESKKMKALNQAKNLITAYETAKLRNSSIDTSMSVTDFANSTDLISSDDIKNLGSITVSQCINMLDTENYNFIITDAGIVTNVNSISTSTP